MKFIPEDSDGIYMNRLVSENELVEIVVYRVIFGYRVRCGFVGHMSCNLDWCAGSEWNDVERLYSLAFAILSHRDEDFSCFEGLPPCSMVKPFYNDHNFVRNVSLLAGEFELLKLEKQPNLIGHL